MHYIRVTYFSNHFAVYKEPRTDFILLANFSRDEKIVAVFYLVGRLFSGVSDVITDLNPYWVGLMHDAKW